MQCGRMTLQAGGQEPETGLTGLKAGSWGAACLPGARGENPVPHLCSSAGCRTPWLGVASVVFKTVPAPAGLPVTVTLGPTASSLRDLCDCSGPTGQPRVISLF